MSKFLSRIYALSSGKLLGLKLPQTARLKLPNALAMLSNETITSFTMCSLDDLAFIGVVSGFDVVSGKGVGSGLICLCGSDCEHVVVGFKWYLGVNAGLILSLWLWLWACGCGFHVARSVAGGRGWSGQSCCEWLQNLSESSRVLTWSPSSRSPSMAAKKNLNDNAVIK